MWLEILSKLSSVSVASKLGIYLFFAATTAAVASSLFTVNLGVIVSATISISGLYIAWRSFSLTSATTTQNRAEKEREDLNRRLLILEKDMTDDLKELKIDFYATIKELKDALTQSASSTREFNEHTLQKMTEMLVQFQTHTKAFGHPAMIKEVSRIKQDVVDIAANLKVLQKASELADLPQKQEIIMSKLDTLEKHLYNLQNYRKD